MSSERLSPAFQFKAANVDSAGVFTGLASTFNGPVDAYGDLIAQGAFATTLAEHQKAGTAPAMLWSHDPNEVVGRWLGLEETRSGLEVTGKLTLGTRRGAEAYALMKDRALALSIGFKVEQSARQQDGARLLKELKLFEVSVVAMPANPAAKILSVKSRPGPIRAYEDLLREVGFSSRESRALASYGWSGMAGQDDSAELTEIAALFKQAATQFQS